MSNKKSYTWESGRCFKMTEEDVYKEGCLPETSQCFDVPVEFSADSKIELLSKIKRFFDVTDQDIEFNSCDEDGRIDISILETEDSQKASNSDISLWKKGKKRLWSSIYSYNIRKVTREAIKL